MSYTESEKKSNSDLEINKKNNSSKKEERKNFDMKKMAFYNPELISKRKVIINTSTSKEMHSFPTTKRFNQSIRDDSPFFYNLPNTLSKRGTSFGYGSKIVFSDSNQYPGPGTYKIYPQINTKGRYALSELPNTQQSKFGREIRFKNQTIANDTPAPNAYHPESMIKGNGIIYNSRYNTNLGKSMGQRFEKVGEKIITPGPGSYKYLNINIYGKYPSSNFSNSQQNKFGKEIRFRQVQENGNPSPDAYNPEKVIRTNGLIYNSRYSSTLGKSMGLKLKNTNTSITPGPGAYEFFSDFEGFYKYGKNKNIKNPSKESNYENGKNGDVKGNVKNEDEGGKSGRSENIGETSAN